MPASPSLFERFGGLELPLADSATLLSTDPVRETLLALFAAGINAELGPAWRLVCGSLANPKLSGVQTPVNKTYGFEPTEEALQQFKAGFPLLALHRSGTARHDEVTMEISRITRPWTLHYILPPVEIGDWHRIGNILEAAAKIVIRIVAHRSHPAYEDGATQLFGNLDPDDPGTVAQFGSLRVVSYATGDAQFIGSQKDAPPYKALLMTLESVEHSGANAEAFPDFTAVDYSASVPTEDGRAVDLVLGQTDAEFPP